MKIQFSITGNRKNFRKIQLSLEPSGIFQNCLHILVELLELQRRPPPQQLRGGGSAILDSPMVTILAVVAMVTVPVAMVTACVAMGIQGLLRHVIQDGGHLTRDPRDRPW